MTAPQAVTWGRDLFRTGEGTDEACPAAIDITGPMRVLVFGPMRVLPAGGWRLTASFALSAEAARYPYILQFIHGESLVEQRFQPAGEGRFDISLENTFEADAVAALRLWLGGAAFHGCLQFFGAVAERRRPAPA